MDVDGVLRLAAITRGETLAPGARSAEESFLFERLEGLPLTSGRFELNGYLESDDGSRPLEVDLLARKERIAIEIDGYFHFRHPDDYRRDRRKDRMLQERDFLVLRFLAEDVASKLEEILDCVGAAVRRRKERGST